MKRIIWLIALILSAPMAMGQDLLDFNNPAILEVEEYGRPAEVTSGHAVSLSVLGLEYSYEWALKGSWSLILRAGVPSVLVDSSSSYDGTSISLNFNFGPRPGLSLEPRYYHNLQKRYLAGKKTANNSANYFSVLTKAYTSVGALNLSLIPTYGIRRGGDHWFQEYSFGVALHTRSVAALLPHLGFRFGYTF